MKLAEKKLNRYYSLTDLSSPYRIAMGMNYAIYLTLANYSYLVLHPGLKLEYFRQQKWEPEWIKTAERMVRDEYSRTYEGRVKTSEATASAHNVDALVSLCDPFLARNYSN